MTDHEPFQREPQNPQDPQVVVFSPELLKLADRTIPRTAQRLRRRGGFFIGEIPGCGGSCFLPGM